VDKSVIKKTTLFKSRRGRWLFVALTILIISALVYSYFFVAQTSPTSFYYWTVKGDNRIDYNSPTQNVIIDFSGVPDFGKPIAGSLSRDYAARCDMNSLIDKQANLLPEPPPLATTYRGVMLCNSAPLSKSDYKIADAYFRTTIDSEYRQFYLSTANDYLVNILFALVGWFAIILTFAVATWANAGQERE
jgi:hypothetical protein